VGGLQHRDQRRSLLGKRFEDLDGVEPGPRVWIDEALFGIGSQKFLKQGLSFSRRLTARELDEGMLDQSEVGAFGI
jgi:hypothetical protein